jgi:surface antigen
MIRIGLILTSLALTMFATGCATNEQNGTLIGAGTGAIIGNQFGHGGGRVAATLGGALVGGFIGNRIGASMDEEDRRRAAEAQYAALENGRDGVRAEWRNPDNGHYGYVTPRHVYMRDSMTCRDFEQTVFIHGRPETVITRACRGPDGAWREV